MTNKTLTELRGRADAAWANLMRQLEGMDAHLDRTDAPGEWTAREVLSHLLFEAGADPASLVARFDVKNLPLLEFEAGVTHLDAARRTIGPGSRSRVASRPSSSARAYLATSASPERKSRSSTVARTPASAPSTRSAASAV